MKPISASASNGKYLFRAVDKHGELIDFMLWIVGTQRQCIVFWASLEDDAALANTFDHYR
jgi:hypothetical protein